MATPFKTITNKVVLNGQLNLDLMAITDMETGEIASFIEDFKKDYASLDGCEVKLTIDLVVKE